MNKLKTTAIAILGLTLTTGILLLGGMEAEGEELSELKETVEFNPIYFDHSGYVVTNIGDETGMVHVSNIDETYEPYGLMIEDHFFTESVSEGDMLLVIFGEDESDIKEVINFSDENSF
ncbi:hypothetical protein [Bacillus sp. Marseille-P3800]|uniref:hypothetical protein n=1 Tax=Bacillus sp. Marseille-P3800 TaxID=2014782 RepID=UPI000C069290|nr:hypothetical protein [Bacillus sp. Marseille-P3800]